MIRKFLQKSPLPAGDTPLRVGAEGADPREQALSDALETWAAWLRRGRWVDGYPGRAAGFTQAVGSTDWTDWEEQVDDLMAEAVDAAVRDLPEVERAAVFATKTGCRYGHGIALAFAYAAARELLLEMLVRRGRIE